MVDLDWIKNNLTQAKILLAKRGDGSEKRLERLIQLEGQVSQARQSVERLRSKRNQISVSVAQSKTDQKLIHQAKMIKKSLDLHKTQLTELEHELSHLTAVFPNVTHESVPSAKQGDQVIKEVGDKPSFSFEPKDHLSLGVNLDGFDIKQAAQVSGNRFVYLKNELARLEIAMIKWVIDQLDKRGFSAMIPPVLVREEAMFGSGFLPTEKNEYYQLEKDNLYLSGTSEVALAGYHVGQIIAGHDLPKKYAAFSSCFRREAGAYGQDTKGVFRLHQFDKVEMFALTHPDQSWQMFDQLLETAESFWQALEIPYRLISINAGELGSPNVKKIDIEAWIPSEGKYREMVSCSNDTDYQARRLNLRFRENGRRGYVHTLNSTALAWPRVLIAIIENFQTEDGGVAIPKILHDLVGFKTIVPKPKN